MSKKGYTVYVVEADSSVRDSLALLLSLEGYAVALFDSVERFLAAMRQECLGCVLIDNRLYGPGLMMLQRALRDGACAVPMVVMNLLGNLGAMPKALCSAAADVLDAPLHPTRLVAAVEGAFRQQTRMREMRPVAAGRRRKAATLTEDEREIVGLIARGLPRREIARVLYLPTLVVEQCVQRLMRKLGAASVVDLPGIAAAA